jgi:translation initiation factor IF-1
LKAQGRVIGALSDAVFQVELSNGHRLYARLSRKQSTDKPLPKIGDIVQLQLTPFDLSKGRILA